MLLSSSSPCHLGQHQHKKDRASVWRDWESKEQVRPDGHVNGKFPAKKDT